MSSASNTVDAGAADAGTTDAGLAVEQLAPLVRQLRLNRPDRLNALGVDMVRQLEQEVRRAEADGMRVLVVRGTGRAFCAGADLKQRQSMDADARFAHNRAINAAFDALYAAPMPTIALINGLALGGGCELAISCDLRFAVSDARIGLTEARIGMIPGAGGTQRLPRLVGAARALELMWTAEPIDAFRAAAIGLVNATLDAAKIDAHVLRVAALIASRSPRTSAQVKALVRNGGEALMADAMSMEREAVVAALGSADYAEGLAAFAEKRDPVFR